MTKARVLVVEDEAIIRSVMVEVLIDAGFQVDEADNSDDALKLLDEDGYRLLVTDVHMPGDLDGIDLAGHAQNHKPPLPVVFVSGRPDVYARLRETGLKGLALAKPFPLEKLVAAVTMLVDTSDT